MNNESSMAPLVLTLADGHDPDVVGGKAINLARLINAGFPVPDGFVVTTHAFALGKGETDSLPIDVTEAVCRTYRETNIPFLSAHMRCTCCVSRLSAFMLRKSVAGSSRNCKQDMRFPWEPIRNYREF